MSNILQCVKKMSGKLIKGAYFSCYHEHVRTVTKHLHLILYCPFIHIKDSQISILPLLFFFLQIH